MITLDLREAALEARRSRDKEWRQQERATLQRSYAAGQVNRLSGDWTIRPTNTRYELRLSLRNIRARSRDLARNNDYIKKFLGMCKSNVIGPRGITLQVRAHKQNTPADKPELDQDLKRLVQAAWAEWSHKENCSASGKLSWLDAQRLMIATLARDGEVLVRKLATKNKFGFALKFIDVNWLDETWSHLLPDGNRIIMSIEMDQHDRAVAYWLTPPVDEFAFPGALYDQTSVHHRTRVPAEEMLHFFLADDENQVRGVPWAHTAMLRLKLLGGYEEAEVVAARVGACKGGFIKPPVDEQYDGTVDDPPIIEEVQPGMLPMLPPGYDFQQYDPNHPNQNYGAFVKSCLRGVASGLEVAYNSLASDLEGVNYSSIRAGLLEERDIWRALQALTIEHFCRPVYLAWLEAAFLSGALDILLAEYVRVQQPNWQPRGWDWVDPLKDVQASVMAINNGLGTRTQTLAEQGEDFDHTVLLLAHEQEVLEAHDLQLVPEKPNPKATANEEPAGIEGEDAKAQK